MTLGRWLFILSLLCFMETKEETVFSKGLNTDMVYIWKNCLTLHNQEVYTKSICSAETEKLRACYHIWGKHCFEIWTKCNSTVIPLNICFTSKNRMCKWLRKASGIQCCIETRNKIILGGTFRTNNVEEMNIQKLNNANTWKLLLEISVQYSNNINEKIL